MYRLNDFRLVLMTTIFNVSIDSQGHKMCVDSGVRNHLLNSLFKSISFTHSKEIVGIGGKNMNIIPPNTRNRKTYFRYGSDGRLYYYLLAQKHIFLKQNVSSAVSLESCVVRRQDKVQFRVFYFNLMNI